MTLTTTGGLILVDLRHYSFGGQSECTGDTVQLATKKGNCPMSVEQSKFPNRSSGRGEGDGCAAG